jgi:hypothetical protein
MLALSASQNLLFVSNFSSVMPPLLRLTRNIALLTQPVVLAPVPPALVVEALVLGAPPNAVPGRKNLEANGAVLQAQALVVPALVLQALVVLDLVLRARVQLVLALQALLVLSLALVLGATNVKTQSRV